MNLYIEHKNLLLNMPSAKDSYQRERIVALFPLHNAEKILTKVLVNGIAGSKFTCSSSKRGGELDRDYLLLQPTINRQ